MLCHNILCSYWAKIFLVCSEMHTTDRLPVPNTDRIGSLALLARLAATFHRRQVRFCVMCGSIKKNIPRHKNGRNPELSEDIFIITPPQSCQLHSNIMSTLQSELHFRTPTCFCLIKFEF